MQEVIHLVTMTEEIDTVQGQKGEGKVLPEKKAGVKNTQNVTSTESMNLQIDPLVIAMRKTVHIPEKRKGGGNERETCFLCFQEHFGIMLGDRCCILVLKDVTKFWVCDTEVLPMDFICSD